MSFFRGIWRRRMTEYFYQRRRVIPDDQGKPANLGVSLNMDVLDEEQTSIEEYLDTSWPDTRNNHGISTDPDDGASNALETRDKDD